MVLRAAGRTTARRGRGGLHGANERAHELTVYLRRNGVNVNSFAGEEIAGVPDTKNTSRFHGDLLETRGRQLGSIFVFLQRPGNTAHPQEDILPDLRQHFAPGYYIGDGQPAAGPQHTEGLGQHLVFIRGEVDHAVGDNDIHRIVRQRDGFDLSLQKLHVARPGLGFVLVRQSQHFISHVETIRFAGWTDTPGRQQNVDASARAEVQHNLAWMELRQRRWVATYPRGKDGGLRQLAGFVQAVEVAGDRVGATAGRGRGPAAGIALAAGHPQRRFAVFLFYNCSDAFRTHDGSFTCRVE